MRILKSKDLLVSGLCDIYGSNAVQIVLYGSVARGGDTEESDIDIAVLLVGEETSSMKDKLIDLLLDLEFQYEELYSVVCLDKERYDQWVNVLPYYKNIKEEGVVLWKAA